MTITAYNDQARQLRVIFDDEQTTPVEQYDIWLASGSRQVVAQPWETPAKTWERVLGTLAALRAPKMHEAYGHFATVYADVRRTKEHIQSHHKEVISTGLYRLADPARNKDSVSRVKALIALCKLHGIDAPPAPDMPLPKPLPTLEQLDAEIARRKGL